MMEQHEIDMIAYAVIGNKLRGIAKQAVNEAFKEVDLYPIVKDAGFNGELALEILASAELIRDAGVDYLSIKDAQEVRWERAESHSDAMKMRFTEDTPSQPPF